MRGFIGEKVQNNAQLRSVSFLCYTGIRTGPGRALHRKGENCLYRRIRESLICTVMMCFVMVLWMSIYNVSLQQGASA